MSSPQESSGLDSFRTTAAAFFAAGSCISSDDNLENDDDDVYYRAANPGTESLSRSDRLKRSLKARFTQYSLPRRGKGVKALSMDSPLGDEPVAAASAASLEVPNNGKMKAEK